METLAKFFDAMTTFWLWVSYGIILGMACMLIKIGWDMVVDTWRNRDKAI